MKQERLGMEEARVSSGLWIAREPMDAKTMVDDEGYIYVDLRSEREHNRECPKVGGKGNSELRVPDR